MRNGGLEDVQHAGAGVVPHLGGELGTIGDDQVLQAVGARPCQLLIVCGPGGGGGGGGGASVIMNSSEAGLLIQI